MRIDAQQFIDKLMQNPGSGIPEQNYDEMGAPILPRPPMSRPMRKPLSTPTVNKPSSVNLPARPEIGPGGLSGLFLEGLNSEAEPKMSRGNGMANAASYTKSLDAGGGIEDILGILSGEGLGKSLAEAGMRKAAPAMAEMLPMVKPGAAKTSMSISVKPIASKSSPVMPSANSALKGRTAGDQMKRQVSKEIEKDTKELFTSNPTRIKGNQKILEQKYGKRVLEDFEKRGAESAERAAKERAKKAVADKAGKPAWKQFLEEAESKLGKPEKFTKPMESSPEQKIEMDRMVMDAFRNQKPAKTSKSSSQKTYEKIKNATKPGRKNWFFNE